MVVPILPPIILPGGGRFKTSATTGVYVSIRPQSSLVPGDVIRWRFSMNQLGRHNSENGPTIEGRIPARPGTPFEECYQFGAAGNMGYRNSALWSHGQYNFEFGVPGVYRVFAWVEQSNGAVVSATQSCVFEIVSGETHPPSVSLGC